MDLTVVSGGGVVAVYNDGVKIEESAAFNESYVRELLRLPQSGAGTLPVTTATATPPFANDLASVSLSNVTNNNKKELLSLAAQGLALMQTILNSAQPTFTNVTQGQAEVRRVWGYVKDEAQVLRRLIRLAVDQLDGTS